MSTQRKKWNEKKASISLIQGNNISVERNSLLAFSDEILLMILSFLSDKELKEVAKTCSHFHGIISENFIHNLYGRSLADLQIVRGVSFVFDKKISFFSRPKDLLLSAIDVMFHRLWGGLPLLFFLLQAWVQILYILIDIILKQLFLALNHKRDLMICRDDDAQALDRLLARIAVKSALLVVLSNIIFQLLLIM